jgi:hypothetical protein
LEAPAGGIQVGRAEEGTVTVAGTGGCERALLCPP